MINKTDINKECEGFLKMMGAENWGSSQVNCAALSFYAGAIVSFNLVTDVGNIRNQKDAFKYIEAVRVDIKANLNKQQIILEELVNKQ